MVAMDSNSLPAALANPKQFCQVGITESLSGHLAWVDPGSKFIRSQVEWKERPLVFEGRDFLVKTLTHTCTFLHSLHDSIALEAPSLTKLKDKTPARELVYKPDWPARKLIF